ncbi:MAG: fucose isomerase [Parasporobacterium sp.]|nr:fucose isomerase [Parasporobacterium sp.]
MENTAIKTLHETVLKCRLVFFDIVHELPYEGPCRFGKGKELEREFDEMINNEAFKGVQMGINFNLPENVEMLEPKRYINHTENWRISEEEMEKLCVGSEETDVYLVSTTGRTGEMIVEFAQMVKKPVIFVGNDYGATINTSAMLARGIETYSMLSWEQFKKTLRVLRARKALANTRVLCVSRFGHDYSLHDSNDSFISLDKVTEVLGTKFRFANLHEVIDQIQEIDPTTNYTTPGRQQLNINADDMVKVNEVIDDLMNNADPCAMERENMLPSVKMYQLVQKLLGANECNAFTANCPDACSTCRINKERFTFCISHSLNNEKGIPSACEYDIAAVVSKAALQAMSGTASYMGNTAVLTLPDGTLTEDGFVQHFSKDHVGPEKWDALRGTPNIVMTQHSVGNRKMKGFDEEGARFSVRPFAYSGFGVTMRRDFDKDAGQVITMCRFSPNCDKLMISKGTLTGGFGYEMDNCTHGALFQVADTQKFYDAQLQVGEHIPLVYGDCTEILKKYGEICGLEVIEA